MTSPMNRRFWLLLTLLAAVALPLPLHADNAEDKEWNRVGRVDVDGREDVERAHVEAEGSFTRIKVKVNGAAIRVKTVTLTYAGGDRETIEVREALQPGESTRAIDLEGNKRRITRIAVNAHTVNREQVGAVVILGRRP